MQRFLREQQQLFMLIHNKINPLDKIVELYERLLQSEREKIELLKNANK